MEKENNIVISDSEVDNPNCVSNPDDESEPESTANMGISEIPIEEYIEMVITQTKEKYPEYASDEIIEDIRKILSNVDSDTRINVIKKYRRAIKEYHKFDDIDQALISVENTQREISNFVSRINNQDHAEAMDARKIIERDILSKYGLHFAVSTDVDIKSMDMDTAGKLDMEAIRKEAIEAQAKAHIFKAAYEAAYRRKMAQTSDNHSLTGDVMEQLMHDRDTIEKSTNINKDMKIRDIDEVIDAVETPSFDIVINKISNEKRLMSVFNDYKKDIKKAKNLIKSAGITDSMVEGFKSFFETEVKFRSMHSKHEFSGPENINPNALLNTAEFFIYHIARICDVTKKRSSYKSIIYKMMILRVLEVQTTVKPTIQFNERFIENNDGSIAERDEFKIRTEMFNTYASLFITAYKPVYMSFIK